MKTVKTVTPGKKKKIAPTPLQAKQKKVIEAKVIENAQEEVDFKYNYPKEIMALSNGAEKSKAMKDFRSRTRRTLTSLRKKLEKTTKGSPEYKNLRADLKIFKAEALRQIA